LTIVTGGGYVQRSVGHMLAERAERPLRPARGISPTR